MAIRAARILATAAVIAAASTTGCREGVLDSVNHAPLIQSVVAAPAAVFTSQEVILRVEATDEDGDGIRYFWASESGSFDIVIGESVRWTAPNRAGDYWIRVNASDRLASTSADVRVRVASP